MIAFAKQYWTTATALMTGFFLAVLFAPIILATADWYSQWEEENNPPATLQWHSLTRLDPDSLLLTFLVTRHKDCQSVRVLGYTGPTLGAMHPVDSLERRDGKKQESYPVGISVVSKPWILRGIYGEKIAISAYYDCKDRIVRAPLLIGSVPRLTP